MQTIIYTPAHNVENEIEIIAQILDNGANYLYIRKPSLDDFSLVDFVEMIPEKYWIQCISTSLIIAKEFDLGGYHFTRDVVQKNKIYNDKILSWLHENNKISSVSAHNIEELKNYANKFKHIIVSPIFTSISKENHNYNWNYEDLRLTINDARLNSTFKIEHSTFFGVGGIDIDKIEKIKDLNLDGVGLLGSLWENPGNAIINFNQILAKLNSNH